MQYFVGAGFYVIPTYSPADHSVDNLVTSTPALFLRNWVNLWTAITEVIFKLMPAMLPSRTSPPVKTEHGKGVSMESKGGFMH